MLTEPWVGQILIYGYLGFLSLIWLMMVIAVSKWGEKWTVLEPSHLPVMHRLSASVSQPETSLLT